MTNAWCFIACHGDMMLRERSIYVVNLTTGELSCRRLKLLKASDFACPEVGLPYWPNQFTPKCSEHFRISRVLSLYMIIWNLHQTLLKFLCVGVKKCHFARQQDVSIYQKFTSLCIFTLYAWEGPKCGCKSVEGLTKPLRTDKCLNLHCLRKQL